MNCCNYLHYSLFKLGNLKKYLKLDSNDHIWKRTLKLSNKKRGLNTDKTFHKKYNKCILCEQQCLFV